MSDFRSFTAVHGATLLGVAAVIALFAWAGRAWRGTRREHRLAVTVAAAILLVSTLSLWPPLRRLHLLNVAVAAWLIGFGWLGGGHPAPPASQNEILTGLVLLLFAIVPNDASRPLRGWRRTG